LYEKEKYNEARLIINRMSSINTNSDLVQGTWIFDKESEKDPQILALNNSVLSMDRSNNSQNATSSMAPSNSLIDSPESLDVKLSPFLMMKRHPILGLNLLIIMV
jgi:hypothetical protein